MEKIEVKKGENVLSRILVADSIKALEACLEPYHHVFAVMDRSVAIDCPAAVAMAEVMNRRGIPGMLIDASEETKTMESVMDIALWLMENGADRDALVLAVGGGITTDMAGFAASIYKRGVRFANVPTTLLAQVDASVGGKTGVNFETYKNMLGVIRQPEFTFICPEVLESLPQRDFLSGAAEMLKTFIIEGGDNYDKAVDLLFRMQKEYVTGSKIWQECVRVYSPELQVLVAACVRVKAGIVSRDQYEKGERRKLNLGHTFAHAIETLAQHASDVDVTHGEAVAMGLVLASRLADNMFNVEGVVDPSILSQKIETDLWECGIPCVPPFALEDMAEVMRRDKKAENGKIRFVLPRAIGDVMVHSMTVEEALAYLKL